MKAPAVYMLASGRNGTLYIGVTSDLIKRVWQHRESVVDGFTKKYSVKILVWYEQHETMDSAICKEKAMKKWLRKWKLATIEKTNPHWLDLWPEITGSVAPCYPREDGGNAGTQLPNENKINCAPVIPCHPRESGGQAGTQLPNENKTNCAPVIPCHPRESGGQAGIQLPNENKTNCAPVIPANAGIQQTDNDLDSRLRGNDGSLDGAR